MQIQQTNSQSGQTPEQIRAESGFLPKYSDFYFEKKKNQNNVWKYVLCYAALIILLPALAKHNGIHPGTVLVCAVVLLILVCLVPHTFFKNRKLLGAKLTDEGIVRITAFGTKPPIPYSHIEQTVAAGDFRYKDAGLQIGHGSEKLVFHYEIGNSTAQKHIEDCHRLLQTHMQRTLPPFEKKGLDLLDRRYFYKKSRRNQVISLLGATAFFLLFYVLAERSMASLLLTGIIFGGWECLSIISLGKNAKLDARNQTMLKHNFKDCPHAAFGWNYTGYLVYILALVLLLPFNAFIILFL